MAELALAAAASAIGGSLATGVVAFGMTGAQIGWMVGSLAGALLFQPKGPDGPRLEDKSVQVSTYGQPIPRVYGTQRMAGNVLWSTELIETATEEGKGGPSYTTYSYRASFAVSVCQGPIAGIRRIWADGKLIFDQSESNTGPQRDYNAQALAIYTGTETQLPDPTIQSYIGDTPAYRGQAYIVFTDLQLEKFGNRLPSLTFEVVQSGEVVQRSGSVILADSFSGSATVCTTDPNTGYVWAIDTSVNGRVLVFDPIKRMLVASIQTGIAAQLGHVVYCPATDTFWCSTKAPLSNSCAVISAASLRVLDVLSFSQWAAVGYNSAQRTIVRISYNALNSFASVYDPLTYTAQQNVEIAASFMSSYEELPSERVFALAGNSSLDLLYADTHQRFFSAVEPGGDLFSGGNDLLAYDSRRRVLYWLWRSDGNLGVYEFTTRQYRKVTLDLGGLSHVQSIAYHPETDSLLATALTAAVVRVYQAQSLAFSGAIPTGGSALNRLTDAIGFEDRLWSVSGNDLYMIPFGTVVRPLPVPLSAVVTAESALVGLSPADLDVSALSSVMVTGFAVSGGGAVRSNLEQLMMAYAFDAVESGGVIKFVRRGGPVVATLDDLDLAAHQPGNDVPTPLPLTRAEEVELPQRVTIRYADVDADYQIGAQSAQRLTGRAKAQASTDLPLVLTASQAQQVAEASLYSAWTARLGTSFTVTHKHAALEPTDIVRAAGNTLRITRRTENAGIITLEASFENGNVFTQSALGAPAGIAQQTIPLRSRTALEFLDVPPLRDQDNDAGFYIGANGYGGTWDGAIVYKSTDGGASFSELIALPSPLTSGSAVTVLAPWIGANEFDESSSVTVVLRSGTLSSLSELAVLNGGNAALLGRELLQFKNATLNADGSYTLRGLLRGRKATPSTGHALGESFVLLNTSSLRRVPPVAGELDQARTYKAVTFGSSLADATPRSFTNTGVALDPLAPVHLGGGRSSTGSLTITWVRRTRIGGAWRDYADAPLSEASESYAVEVWNASYTTLVRTLTSSTPTVDYTSAQQVADFGSNQATVYLRVFQVSASAGRGSALQGTV